MAELRLTDLTRRRGEAVAVSDLTLTVEDGELVVLLGSAAAGKTTTLRLVAGLARPESGTVAIAGADVTRLPPGARDIAFVFPRAALYPHLTAAAHLAFALRAPGRAMAETGIGARIDRTADLLGIEHCLADHPPALSDDDAQRLAIARALVRDAAVHLLDDPLAPFGPAERADLRLALRHHQREAGATFLFATADAAEAMAMADRIGVLEAGRLIQVGSPRELYEAPIDTHVATRLGSPPMNLLPQGLLAEGGAPGGTRTLGVRAENVRLVKVDGRRKADGTVARVDAPGGSRLVHVDLGGVASLVALAPPDAEFAPGDRVTVKLARPLWFDAAGHRIAARG